MDHAHKEDYKTLEKLATRSVRAASSSSALLAVLVFLGGWLIAGPLLGFSNGWQQVLSTVSSAVTLVMVFLLVRTQGKDTLTIQIKLNEMIATQRGANNQLISIENLSEAAIVELQKRYENTAVKLAHDHAHDHIVSTDAISPHEIGEDGEPQPLQKPTS